MSAAQTKIIGSPDILEGVISLPNNTNQWGLWSGKILTGDETSGILYTVDTNGTVTPYNFGIGADDFVLIPSNQDLYLIDYGNKRILKLSSSFLSNYVGDLLIVQCGAGETVNSTTPALFIVNWATPSFIIREISLSSYTSQIEDAAFAPLDLPSQPLQ